MRKFVFIATLLISSSSFAQEELDKRISANVCSCLDHFKTFNEDSAISCFQLALEKDKELIIRECISLYHDSSAETGHKFGHELYGRLSVNMIFTCEKYYALMDTIRNSSLRGLNKDSIRNSVLTMSKRDPKTRNKEFFIQRGIMYFEISDLGNALNDFNDVIKLDQNSVQSMYFKAWIFELMKNYDGAFALYSKIAQMTNGNEFKIFAAIVKRKRESLK